MELERYYAECKDCCSGFSAYDRFKVNDWADLHEFEYKHKVKIECEAQVTDPRSW